MESFEDGSQKFWEIWQHGAAYSIRFGKIGTQGQTKTKELASESAAESEVENLVREQKRYAPNDIQTGGNRIADAIRAYPNPTRPLSYRIISDAKDEKGKPIASNVEHGHRAVNGEHVAARPSFFPVYRAHKEKIRRRVLNASRRALKKLYPG